MFAALYRSASNTVLCWPGWCRQLKAAAQEALPVSRWTQGHFYPKFWDSTPFACNLEGASLGFTCDAKLTEGINSALREIQIRGNDTRDSLQKVVYKHLLISSFRVHCVQETILKRVSSIFKPYDLHDTGINIHSALSMCSRFRKHDVMRILKTWCNAWATSHRFHETIRLPCLFGCSGATDSLTHYIHCPYWLHVLQRVLPQPPSVFPLTRLGLVDPTKTSLLSVAASFAGYHAIKRHATTILTSSDDCTVEQRLLLHRIFVDAFIAEATESGLQTLSLATVLAE